VADGARILRSLTFEPAHDPDRLLAAADAGVDAVCADFEDLTPRADKARARELFPAVARELAGRGVAVMARTNDIGAGAEEDLEAIVGADLHCVNVPKVRSAEHVRAFCQLLDRIEAERGLRAGHTLVRPVVETAEGVRNAYEVATASPRVTYMGGVAGGFWGDLGATVGSIIGPDGSDSFYLRSKVLIDVRAAGVRFPIGGGATARRDPESVREFAWQNRRLGYDGHFTSADPETVAIVNEVFTPTAEDLAEYRRVVPILERCEREGEIVVRLDGKLYDTAGLPRVRNLLALAERLGLS
jgi:citrate lyase subunit beta/citryl-CoA lyase